MPLSPHPYWKCVRTASQQFLTSPLNRNKPRLQINSQTQEIVLTAHFIIMCTKVGSEHSPLQTLKKPVFHSLGKHCHCKGIVTYDPDKNVSI